MSIIHSLRKQYKCSHGRTWARASEAGVWGGGVCRDLTPQLFMCGDIDTYNIHSRKNLIPGHANCMQHVLGCWERQSDGSEYKKTLRRLGLRPGPRWGSLQRSRKPYSWWRGADCPLPKNPVLRSRPFGPSLSYLHSKISSDAVGQGLNYYYHHHHHIYFSAEH